MTASAKQLALLATVYLSCLLFLFYPGLVNSKVPAFRDAYHFYYPQAVWLAHCAEHGEYFPQWDCNTGFGASCPGQSSYALFYPLRFLWLVPGCSVEQRYSLFIVTHLFLAAIGAAYAAKRLALSRQAQLLAAVSYSLSCPVLFQHNNLIYLTSAAWIGFALASLIDLIRFDRSARSSFLFSFALAMMLLGGDPHTMVNALIVASGASALAVMRHLPASRHLKQNRAKRRWSALLQLGKWMLIAAISIPALTAVQWIPMLRLALRSERLVSDPPLSDSLTMADSVTNDTTATETNQQLAHIIASVPSRPQQIYDFSLSPWHVATAIWPTLGGHYLPSHSRWFALLSAEGRMWIPSIYFGFVPCLLVLRSIRRGAGSGLGWLLILALFSLLASFGNYSLIWLVRESARAIGMAQLLDALPADRVGSVYWGLTQLLPGYDTFRYPAKWTVWFAVACSLAAAVRFDRSFQQGQDVQWLPRTLRAVLLVSSSLVCAFGFAVWLWSTWDPTAVSEVLYRHSDAWLGTPQLVAIGKTLMVAGCLPLTVLAILSARKWAWRGHGLTRDVDALGASEGEAPAEGTYPTRSGRRFEILALTLIEMTCAAALTMSFVEPPSAAELRAGLPLDLPLRVWADVSEANFVNDFASLETGPIAMEQAHYQNQFLLGKLSSIPSISNLAATQSIYSSQLSRLRRWLAGQDDLTSSQPDLDQVLAQLGITHRLIRIGETSEEKKLVWQAVPVSRPLCEMVVGHDGSVGRLRAGTLNPDTRPLDWVWLSSSRLLVQVNNSVAGKLLIRQLNDGGWAVALETADGQRKSHDLPAMAAENFPIFVEIPVAEETVQVILSRKPLW